jgi:membrane associated rhomboid family serine protease
MWMRGVPVMRTGLGTLLVLNLALTLFIPGISKGGHVGGLIGGGICGAVMLRPHRPGENRAWDVLVPVVVAVVAVIVGLSAANHSV